MIRNIIFDLGNVLISFRPADYFTRLNYPQDLKNKILTDIFASREWLMLDNGDISLNSAIESIAKKTSLEREEIARIFNLRLDIMFPLRKNADLLPALKKRGFRLYYLSNFPIDIFDDVKNSYEFFRHFDGGIISSEVRYSKPDPLIYDSLLKKYGLKPAECLYIDDVETNVLAAEASGMKGFTTFGSDDISASLIEKLS
jgi:putative hydrolase of the HAD superfamily